MFRSILFTPADRPDRIAKALASGAALVCVDLEDAVAPDRKAAARAGLAEAIAGQSDPGRILVRINSVEGLEGLEDIGALIATRPAIRGLMLPKVQSARDAALMAGWLAAAGLDWRLTALIEDARGLGQAAPIGAAPRVEALALGAVDMAASLGATLHRPALDAIRLQLKLAAAEAGVLAVDGPDLDFHDAAVVGASARQAATLGFDGKLAIHPAQIAAINTAFAPTPEAVDQARRLLHASAAAKGGVTVLDGRMVDRPVIEAAKRVMQRAGLAPAP